MSIGKSVYFSHSVPLSSWDNNLISFLGSMLGKLLPSDYRIHKSGDFTQDEERKLAIHRSDIFIVILTDEYIKSEICLKEVNLATSRNVKPDIFKVLKTDVLHAEQPVEIADLLGYNFFEREIQREQEEGYEEFLVYEVERRYWSRITDLAFDIYKAAGLLPEKNELCIYIAETTPDQEKNRENLKRELKRLGYKVFPDKTLPEDSSALVKEVLEYLRLSSMSVHIIGSYYGEPLLKSEFSLVDLQNKIAANYSEKLSGKNSGSDLFTRLIWMDPDLKVSNEKQRLFIEQLKRDTDSLTGASLIQNPIEIFKSFVLSKLKSASIELHKEINNLDPAKTVYLIHESSNAQVINNINEILLSKGFKVLESPLLSEEKNLIKKHRDNFLLCDLVLIYFDSNDIFWLKSKVNDLMKAPGFGKRNQFIAKTVLHDCNTDITEIGLTDKGISVINLSQIDLLQAVEQFALKNQTIRV